MCENNSSTSVQDKPRRRRRLTTHIIVNRDQIDAGQDDQYRALCGHIYAVRYRIDSRVVSREEKAQWIQCPACEELRLHREEMKRDQGREEKALRLARHILEKMGDQF